MFVLLKTARWLPTGFILFLSLGCGGSGEKLDLAAAKGTVKLDGQPLPNVIVKFHPDDKGVPATGTTDENGQFTLTTKEPGDGALVGKHKISVNLRQEEPDMEITSGDAYDVKPKESKFPAIYTKADQSGLSQEVKASGDNDFVIELHAK